MSMEVKTKEAVEVKGDAPNTETTSTSGATYTTETSTSTSDATSSTETTTSKPTVILTIGMAGSGKTTFMQVSFHCLKTFISYPFLA